MEMMTAQKLEKMLTSYHGHMGKDIDFKDISPILLDPDAFSFVIDSLARELRTKQVDKIVAAESRGFIFGAPLAYKLDLPFVMIRKHGKLPGSVVQIEYKTEYSNDIIEMQFDSITKDEKVAFVDDVLATGGTALASCRLIEKCGGQIESCLFVVNLMDAGMSTALETLFNTYKDKVFTLVNISDLED